MEDNPETGHHWATSEDEEEFNNGVREITIIILAGIVLLLGAYAFLARFLKKVSDDDDLLAYLNREDDEMVYKISLFMCCFSLAVSAGSALLLPISSISNEVLHRYPDSWYIKWLNSSLIHGIWNLIFALSNASLLIFLPFAYLFCESEGFFGYRKGLVARAKETVLTLVLLSFIILGLMYIMAALIDWDHDSIEKMLNMYSYLPLLYSWMSFLGVLMLSICTPLGFAKLFTLAGDLLASSGSAGRTKTLEEDLVVAAFEEDYLAKRVSMVANNSSCILPSISSFEVVRQRSDHQEKVRLRRLHKDAREKRQNLLQVKKASSLWRWAIGYPLMMLLILALMALCLLCVLKNVGQIVAGFKALPAATHSHETLALGLSSLSSLGVAGVILEVILICYLLVTSVVGLYTIPGIRSIRPARNGTTLTRMILNCALYVILSSALPLLAKILGITNFDLLGSFGKLKWLGNFYIVLLYNVFFAATASLCLFNTFTAKLRNEILSRLSTYIEATFKRT